MSRRKQACPQQRLASTELSTSVNARSKLHQGSPSECLSETTQLLHLPDSLLRLTPLSDDWPDEQIDGIYSYIVCAKKPLDRSHTFGPFRAELVADSPTASDSLSAPVKGTDKSGTDNKIVNNTNKTNENCLKTEHPNRTMTVHIKEESGSWLKILRMADKDQDANATIKFDGGQVWCTILCDISESNEVRIKEPIKFISDQIEQTDNDSDDRQDNNGSQLTNCEDTTDVDEDDDGSARSSQPEDDDEELEVDDDCYTCVPCGIAFSCKDTLSAHQTYYCVNRQNNTNSRNHMKTVWPQKEPLGGVVLIRDKHKNNIISVSDDNSVNQRNASIYTNDTASHESAASAEVTESSSPDDSRFKRLEKPNRTRAQDLRLTPTTTDGTIIKQLNGSQQQFDNELQSDDELLDKTKQLHSTGSGSYSSIENLDTIVSKKSTEQTGLTVLANSGVTAASGRVLGTTSGSAKYSKTGGVYSCKSCTYATDKKALLLKHVRSAHGQALAAGLSPLSATSSQSMPAVIHQNNTVLTTTDESDDNDFQQNTSAPQDRYCTNCDIQFNSFKTYKVHKELYCGSRHNSKYSPSMSTSIVGGQSVNSVGPVRKRSHNSETDGYTAAAHQRLIANSFANNFPKLLPNTTAIANNQSPFLMPTLAGCAINPANAASLLSQPVYIAISTNPLILVPCSYNPTAPGNLSLPSITPMGNPFQVPADVLSANQFINSLNTSLAANLNPFEAHNNKTRIAKTTNTLSSKSSSQSSDEQPLDLSSKQQLLKCLKSGDDNNNNNRRLKYQKTGEIDSPDECNTRSTCSPQTISTATDLSAYIQSQTIAAAAAGGTGMPAVEVLVKQGKSRCNECNIVFYKHENYLVHKRMYCASRRMDTASSSPEHMTDDIRNSSPELLNDGKSSQSHSATLHTSPARSAATVSPAPSPTNQSQQPVFQFYCAACGIKFTSLDNLQAHQTYYCLKRTTTAIANSTENIAEAVSAAAATTPGSDYIIPNNDLVNEYHCPKCKATYVSEETLLAHVCSELNLINTNPYPSLATTQKHVTSTTSGALTMQCFKCTICGYKGHTLRGMRTHVRIHQDKIHGVSEETFITCIDEDIPTRSNRGMGGGTRRRRSIEPVNNVVLPASNASVASSNDTRLSETEDNVNSTDTELMKNELKNGDKCTANNVANNTDMTHNCQFCYYSSTYKGNVVRHIKLVHKDLVHSPPSQTQSLPADRVKKEFTDNEENSHQSAVSSDQHSDEMMSGEEPLKPISLMTGTNNNNISAVNKKSGSPLNNILVNSQALPLLANNVGSNQSVANSVNNGGTNSKKIGPKYCRSCDISFNYLASFIAHKKYYCSSHNSESSAIQSHDTSQMA